MALRFSQWGSMVLSNPVSTIKILLPAIGQWTWYGLRRLILVATAKYALDTMWLMLKKRVLGVSFLRELSLMSWTPPSYRYEWNPVMRMFIRKCGYHYSPGVSGVGKRVEPWFYGEIVDDTKKVLEKIEKKALRREQRDKAMQAKEMETIIRIFRNFGEFNMNEYTEFFKYSELIEMEDKQEIFGSDDNIEYFYGVVSGEIRLLCSNFGNRGEELLKIVGEDGCIVSTMSFFHIVAIGPQKFGELHLRAVCSAPGKYFRTPMKLLIKYFEGDNKKMFEIISTILVRHYKFTVGLNDLTGILPRLHKQSYLDANYTPINIEPGLLAGVKAREAFEGLREIMEIDEEDKRLCWVGVLDSRTILLRRYKQTKYAFYIHEGLVACTVSKLRRSYNAIQFYLSSGQIVGWREAIVGLEMAVQYQVADDAKALIIGIPDFLAKKYVVENPRRFVNLSRKLFDRFSLLSRQIEFAIQFTHKRANEVVYKKNLDDNDIDAHAYFCLCGRMRFTVERDIFHKRDNNRYGIIEKGDWFGMIAMYNDMPQMHRVIICDRYAEYAIVPRYLLSAITAGIREAAGYQCDYMARCIHRDHEHTFLDTDKMADSRFQVNSLGAHTWRTYRMVCIYPISEEVPAKLYCDELARHHTSSAAVLTREDALKDLKLTSFQQENEYDLAKWLVLEEEKTTVLFLIATNDSADIWNETIAKLCDLIQVVVTLHIPHKPDANELNMLQMSTKSRKELVFLHSVIRVTYPQVGPAKFPHLPQGSILYLMPRPWVHRHHHVRMIDSAFKYMKDKNPNHLSNYHKQTKDPDKHNDFGRVMRWISGQSVGLVLGGGGAKGAAHLGALHYLHELNVPVDYVAGVSIGSFLGALYAVYENIHVVESKAKELWEELKNPFRYSRDIALTPFSALFRGHSFNWMIFNFFGSIQIEDLYIPYFCVSTDLNDHCSRTHMSGDLWFYVRASMTLTMVFPPQINQFDYHLLMDGGYSDLVPAMTMRRLGIKYLVAINIGDEQLMNTFNFGYHVSGMKCILQNLHPFSIDMIPHHFDFWDSLLYCSARNFLQILKAMDEYCIYIRPNINAFDGLDFQYYDEIKTAGYLSTKFKFGGLHLKNLPIHVIWYLLRFYTYPGIAMSQAQMLEGFTDDDWDFAVQLMSKTQMFTRARTTLLKMNLTPYLTDVMEARSYLENIIKEEEVRNINLHVPVLENFSRDDERLDLVHAIARMKEWTYMEDFENIVLLQSMHKSSGYSFKTKVKVHSAASQPTDLLNASESFIRKKLIAISNIETHVKDAFSIKDLFKADPTLFHGVASYHHLRSRKDKLKEDGQTQTVTADRKIARAAKTTQSLPSLSSIIAGFVTKNAERNSIGKPTEVGQRLHDFRQGRTKADRKKNSKIERSSKMTKILTLKELRKSLESQGITQLQ